MNFQAPFLQNATNPKELEKQRLEEEYIKQKNKAKEKAIKRAQVIEEYTKKFRDNKTLLNYYKANIISPDFFKLEDYHDYDHIRKAIPSCAKMNDPSFNPYLMGHARFFIIRSCNEDDVHKAIKYGSWCSTEHNNQNLDEAFKSSQAFGYQIYLIFT